MGFASYLWVLNNSLGVLDEEDFKTLAALSQCCNSLLQAGKFALQWLPQPGIRIIFHFNKIMGFYSG